MTLNGFTPRNMLNSGKPITGWAGPQACGCDLFVYAGEYWNEWRWVQTNQAIIVNLYLKLVLSCIMATSRSRWYFVLRTPQRGRVSFWKLIVWGSFCAHCFVVRMCDWSTMMPTHDDSPTVSSLTTWANVLSWYFSAKIELAKPLLAYGKFVYGQSEAGANHYYLPCDINTKYSPFTLCSSFGMSGLFETDCDKGTVSGNSSMKVFSHLL